MTQEFSHFDARGNAAMVDVGAKPVSERTATARARVVMLLATLALIRSGGGAVLPGRREPAAPA